MSTEIEAEVARRLEELREKPHLLNRYDVDQSGDLDDDEWALIERILTVEVAHGIAREKGELADPDVPDGHLHGRFEVTGLLGVGGQGRTWLARDIRTGGSVAVKEMAVREAVDWKSIELFERESETLESLNHPAIPRYIDAFHTESEDDGVRFFLVQEFVDGTPLDTDERQWSQDEAIELMRDALEILTYLHDRSPPVIHRDIKPSNLIRRHNGTLSLIDFGAVSTISSTPQGGSTVVGTNGYMPIEQFMGRAEARTDLYALAATVVHLLSRVHPADLPVVRSRIQFEDHVNVSDDLAELLGDMLSPIVDDRPESATAVIETLDAIQFPPGPVPDERALAVRKETPVANTPRRDVIRPPKAKSSGGGGSRSTIAMVMIAFTIAFGIRLFGFALSSCGGAQEALAVINECPHATATLGGGIHQSWLGMTCGSTESSGCGGGARGNASISMPVAGDDAAGRYRYRATLQNGMWRVIDAEVRNDGTWTDVVPCSGNTYASGDTLQCEGRVCQTGSSPLAHNINEATTWDPCDGGMFTYEADIDFESCCDYVSVGEQEHTGYGTRISGFAIGEVRVAIHTDGSVDSEGVRRLEATCVDDVPEARYIDCDGNLCQTRSSLPHNVNDMTLWDPCDGRPFSFQGAIDFEPCCDYVEINGAEYNGYDETIRGGAMAPAVIRLHTDSSVNSDGIRELEASCELETEGEVVDCSGERCTTGRGLPDDLNETVFWDPCDGGPFRWRGRIQTEECCDFVQVGFEQYSGDERIRGDADGPLLISVRTDGSIGSRGIRRLRANCE